MIALLGLTPKRPNETLVTKRSESQDSSDSKGALDTAVSCVAQSTCGVVSESEVTRDTKERTVPLISYAKDGAYVLTAEPGASKTTAFETGAASQRVHKLSDLRRQAGVAGQNALSGRAR